VLAAISAGAARLPEAVPAQRVELTRFQQMHTDLEPTERTDTLWAYAAVEK